MKSIKQPLSVLGIALGAAMLLPVSTAHAAAIVQFDIAVLGGSGGPFATSFVQNGAPTPWGQVFNYQGSLNDPSPANDWSIVNWDFNADNNPAGSGDEAGARIASVFTVQNNMVDGPTAADNYLRFSIMITMNVMAAGQPTMFGGNAGMTLTIDESANGFAGVLRPGAGSIWNFMVDGADVATLFNAPLGNVPGPFTDSFSEALSAGQTGPLMGMSPSSIGIRLDFELSPGESVTFNGVFGFIPAPGALALLGLAGIAGRPRRRS